MTDGIGRVRCPFCLELGAVCRAGRVSCCALCQCGKHALAEPPPAPSPWVDLGVGGAPIHPRKCSAQAMFPYLDEKTGKQTARMGCIFCGALERYRTTMRLRVRGVFDTHGEAAPAA